MTKIKVPIVGMILALVLTSFLPRKSHADLGFEESAVLFAENVWFYEQAGFYMQYSDANGTTYYLSPTGNLSPFGNAMVVSRDGLFVFFPRMAAQ